MNPTLASAPEHRSQTYSRRQALKLLAGSGLLALAGCGREAPSNTLRFGYVFGGARKNTPPGVVGWAFERGLMQPALARIGLTQVEFIASGGPAFNQMFAARAIDVFTTGDSPGIIGYGSGLDFQVLNVDMLGYNLYLVTREDGPRTVRELAGRKVTSYPASNTWRYVHGLLVTEDIASQVQRVNVPQGESEAALLRGEVDAISVSFGPLFVQRGFRILDEAARHPELTGSLITVGGRTFLEQHPEFVGTWNDVIAQALLDARSQADAYFRFQASTSALPEWALRELYPLTLWDTDPLPPRGRTMLESTKAFLLEQRAIRRDFDLNEWIAPALHRGLSQPRISS